MATKTQYYNLDKPSYDEVADIEIINANFDKIDQQMRNNADGVNFAKSISSDAYDNSKLYEVGDYCIYDNKLYRCITAIESAEAFNIAKWKQTTVGKEVKQLNSNLVGLKVGENCGGKNLFDENEIFSSIGTKEDGYWYVNSVNLHNMYSDGFPISIDVNSQYTISFDAIGSDKSTTIFYVKYTDGTKDIVIVYGNSESHYKLTTKAGKIISFIGATYSYGGIDKFKNFQIEKGADETDYEPYIPSVKMLADEVNEQNDSLEDLEFLGWSVPKDCPIQNYVDSNGVFHQRVGRVNLGSLNWVIELSPSKFGANFSDVAINTKNLYCSKYSVGVPCASSTQMTDKTVASHQNGHTIHICDTSYTDATTFKNAMQCVYLYYELETENVISVGNEKIEQIKNDLGGLSFSASGTTLTITDGNNTWTLTAN